MPSLAAQPAATKNLTKREVIEALGKSKRTIETYIKDGRLACTYINGRNGRQALFDADAVAALKREIDTPAEKPAAPRIVPAAEKPAKTQPPDGAQFTLADVSRVVAALAAQTPKPWLTLGEAAEFSGLPKAWLLAVARLGHPESAADRAYCDPHGTVVAVNVGSEARASWRFNREALAKQP
jgi:hypothetical protein